MKFIQNFTNAQFAAVEKQIASFFKGKDFKYNTNHKGEDLKPLKGSFDTLDSVLGFAYTSTGICAAYWACNGVNIFSSLLPTGFNYLQGFCYDESGQLWAIFQDENETEFYLKA
jgi:hypothetical protein